jgi:hypothetical protein
MVRRSRATLVGAAVVVAVAIAGALVASGDDPPQAGRTAAAPATTDTTGREPAVMGDMLEREPDDRDVPPSTLLDEGEVDAGAPPESATPVTAAATPPRSPPASPPPPPPPVSPVPVPVLVLVTVLGDEGLLVWVELTGAGSSEPVDTQQGSVGEYALTAPGPGTWALAVSWTSTAVIEADDGTMIGGGSLALKHVFEVSGPGPVRFACSMDEGCVPA